MNVLSSLSASIPARPLLRNVIDPVLSFHRTVAKMCPPLINDVATDLDDPPSFTKEQIGPLPEDFKPIIREHYSDLKPATFAGKKKGTVFRAVLKTATSMPRWTIKYENADEGVVEGISVTALLRFRDDFVIRVRPKDDGSIVDMRSRSRLGKGDFGANAKRIREYFDQLRKELQLGSVAKS